MDHSSSMGSERNHGVHEWEGKVDINTTRRKNRINTIKRENEGERNI